MDTFDQNFLPVTTMGSGVPDAAIPEAVIPPKMRELICAFQQTTAAPIPTIFCGILATLATSYGGTIDVESWISDKFPLNFYALIASGTGEAKTSAINAIMKPLRDYDYEIEKQQDSNKSNYLARLKRWEIEKKIIEAEMEEAIKNHSKHVDMIEANLDKHISNKPQNQSVQKNYFLM